MDFTLGSPAIPPFFKKTYYENSMEKFHETMRTDPRELFRSILERRGSDITLWDLTKEMEEPFHALMEDYLGTRTNELSDDTLDRIVRTAAHWIWLCYQHFAGGEKVFRIHENLGKALNATDLRVPSAYLNLPYDGICLSYGGTVAEILSGEAKGIVDSAYLVSRYPIVEGYKEANLRYIRIYSRREGGLGPFLDVVFRTLGHGKEIVDEAFLKKALVMGLEDADFQVALLVLKTIAYINSAGSDALEEPAPDQVIKAILADPIMAPPREERRKLQKRLESSSRQPFIYIGSRLPTPREEQVSFIEGGVRQMTHRFTVRGHFHGFWKLEKNLAKDEHSWVQEREGDWVLVLKWVHPYEKGPSEAEKLHRRYFVEGPG